MGENSAIEWTDHTFNPWMGCSKVSEGCAHCYAERDMDLRFGKVKWGPNGTRNRTSPENWRQPLKWNREAAESGIRKRVFCASLADVFEDRPEYNSWRRDLCVLIEQCRHLDWLLLTKRPAYVRRMVSDATGRMAQSWFDDCQHVAVGTSIENYACAIPRLQMLSFVPSRIRFLSCEPLLGRINFDELLHPWVWEMVNWVIVGGESGPNARRMHADWVRSLRDQCVARGVPFFFKQWGEWDETGMRVGKKAAGRLLDGREWNELPTGLKQ